MRRDDTEVSFLNLATFNVQTLDPKEQRQLRRIGQHLTARTPSYPHLHTALDSASARHATPADPSVPNTSATSANAMKFVDMFM